MKKEWSNKRLIDELISCYNNGESLTADNLIRNHNDLYGALYYKRNQ